MTIHHSEHHPDVIHRPTGNRAATSSDSADVMDMLHSLAKHISSAISSGVSVVSSAAHQAAKSIPDPEQRFIFNTMMMGTCTPATIKRQQELERELFYLQNPVYDPYFFTRKVKAAGFNQDTEADKQARAGDGKTQYQKDLEYLFSNPIANVTYIYWTEVHRESHQLGMFRARLAGLVWLATGRSKAQHNKNFGGSNRDPYANPRPPGRSNSGF